MNILPKYDESELVRLHNRLLLQKVNAFFCLIANAGSFHNEIAEKISERFPSGEVQVIDFGKLGSNFVYSSSALSQLINKGVRILFLANFQLACGDLQDEKFFQILNLSRDNLAEMPYVLVFMMPYYFRVKIVQYAPDFNSFFQYHTEFKSPEKPRNLIQPEIFGESYSETKKELLKYYLEKYRGLEDHESMRSFELVLKILELNSFVHCLPSDELNFFYVKFTELLTLYRNEFDNSAFDIAFIYNSQGEYDKAVYWYQKARDISEHVLGLEHPDTVAIYNNIANVYHDKNDYTMALSWHKKAIEIYEKVLGVEHLNTAASYNNIATVYCNQNDYTTALSWYEKALKIFEKVLGVEHPNTSVMYNNIASAYYNQGDYDEALDLFQKALAIREYVLGKDHPDTATVYNNIADIYQDQADNNRALSWFCKSYRILQNKFGDTHPKTKAVKENMEAAYNKSGHSEPFEQWLEKAMHNAQ